MAAVAATMLAPVLPPRLALAAPAADTAASSQVAKFEEDLDNFVKQTARAESMDPRQLQQLRERFGFRRTATGKVQLLSSQAREWYDIRLDMQLPGVCILRNPKGDVFVLELAQVQQIDLSNDLIVVALFGDRQWEDALQPLGLGDGGEQLNMGAREFRESLGILSDLLEVAAVEQQQQGGGKKK